MKRLILTSSLIFTLILLVTFIAILYGKGYRFAFDKSGARFEGTGIMVLSSKPDGALVYINNHLTTATNNTINLAPGEYEVRIEKDGYFGWKKKMIVRKEIVAQANALLFPVAPKLEAVTVSGAKNAVTDPTGTLIAYTVSSSSAALKNGVYVLDMNNRPFIALGSAATQLVSDTQDTLFSQSELSFSPDGSQLIASVSGSFGGSTYLLSTRGFNQNPQDITATISQNEKDWEKQRIEKARRIFDLLPQTLRPLAITVFKNPTPSVEEDKILYTASVSASLPIIKNPRLVAVNATSEERTLKAGSIYVYDIKEDRNYLIYEVKTTDTPKVANTLAEMSQKPPLYTWHPGSNHLIYVKNHTIVLSEFDGQNPTTVYAGPFNNDQVFPWADGSSLVILTNFNIPDAPPNLYRISLK